MTSPYAEPTTIANTSPGVANPSNGRGWLIAGLICGFVSAIVTTILGVFVLPKFSEVFAQFGATLPLVTKLVINYYLLIWVVPLGLFFAWRWPGSRRRNMVMGMIGIGSSVAVIPTMIIAVYLPIFAMAATV
jgi:type II secretory pathway component PulF